VNGAYIAPGFIDTHIHGFGGFGTDGSDNKMDLTDSVVEMSRLLARYGVTAFNPTLYPAEGAAMLEAVRKIAAAKGKESGPGLWGSTWRGPFYPPNGWGSAGPKRSGRWTSRLWSSYGKPLQGGSST